MRGGQEGVPRPMVGSGTEEAQGRDEVQYLLEKLLGYLRWEQNGSWGSTPKSDQRALAPRGPGQRLRAVTPGWASSDPRPHSTQSSRSGPRGMEIQEQSLQAATVRTPGQPALARPQQARPSLSLPRLPAQPQARLRKSVTLAGVRGGCRGLTITGLSNNGRGTSRVVPG